MSSSRTYKGIEIFRVVAAFLVVAIHTSPLAGYSGTADFVFTRVIARVAVPFFFMVTGYFVLSKGTGVRRFLKKTAIIYAASAALTIDPAPDSLLRAFMAWRPLEEPVAVETQEIVPFVREGFTVVEWGGAEVER